MALSDPLNLHIPGICMFCAAVGRVTLETTVVMGDTLHLRWCCRRCRKEWPVTMQELRVADGRHDTPDRRKQ